MFNYKTSESQNYIFHYLENSLAEKEIDLIINEQEKVIEELKNFFSIDLPFKINYFLLNTPAQVGKIYGDNEACNGFAKEPNLVYAVYNYDVKCIGYHEDAHIVSYLINKPKLSFIREGLAMFFDKTWWGKENEKWVFEFLENGQYINIINLMYNQEIDQKCEITYPIAGAFTKFLIDVYGKNKYIELYKCQSINEATFLEIFNNSVVGLEESFIYYIKNIKGSQNPK